MDEPYDAGMDDAIDLAQKLTKLDETWSPGIVARMNDLKIVVVKVQGEFVWHKHDDTDDFFLVLLAGSRSSCATATTWSSSPASSTWCRAGSSTARARRRRRTCS